MGHQQPPTQVEMENTSSNSIFNGMAKQNRSQAIDMKFYWVRDRIRQNHFHIFWEEGKKNLADYVTKHHPIWHHRAMRPTYDKVKKKIYKPQNTGKLGPGEGLLELPIPGESVNRIIPLRESGIRIPRARIIPLRESGI